MSQSAISYSLKKLRAILNDDLLIRTSRDMEVTPFASEISDRVRQILLEIQTTLLAKDNFDPATTQETFRIAMSDYVEATIGVYLIQQLATQASGMKIRIGNLEKETIMNELDADRVDLAINPGLNLKSWHISQELYHEEFVCVFRGDKAIEEISLAEYLERSHILVSLRDDFNSESDRILAKQQKSRRVIWSTCHFMSVPFLLNSSLYSFTSQTYGATMR